MLGRGMPDKRTPAGSAFSRVKPREVSAHRCSRPVRRRIKHGTVAALLGFALVALFAPDVLDDARSSVSHYRHDEPRPKVHRGRTRNGKANESGWGNSSIASKVVHLDLTLPDKYRNRPEFASKESTYKHWGFDLRTSNKLPIDRLLPDYRSEGCKAIKYPEPAEMPKVSVIIIHFNEPLSTLLRNIISVINNSPPTMLGEIVLVDDNSTIDELSELQHHLDAIRAQTSPRLIRSFHRSEHTGIVGARIRGAKEAKFEVIIFLDSHCETLPGWLEPMVARIMENRKRVIVPNIRGFHLDTLTVFDNPAWPPSKGILSWRVNFNPVAADLETDLLDPSHPFESPVKNPVMPGGLFAIERAWFWESGAYDPELLYYGAEHVEMSVRLWMCGGTMEALPCSNVGHIYREFNRFDNAFDPLIKNVHIGRVLNRNDARVAEVWLDEYKQIFTRMRLLKGLDLGPDLNERIEVRERLQCQSFKWYIENVLGPRFYVPDLNPKILTLRQPGGALCLRAGDHYADKVPAPESCVDPATISPYDMVGSAGHSDQLWSITKDGHIQSAFMRNAKDFVCLRTTTLEMTGCADAVLWDIQPQQRGIHMRLRGTTKCMGRRPLSGDPAAGTIQECGNSSRQLWQWEKLADGSGNSVLLGVEFEVPSTSSDKTASSGMCLDNMQRTRGGVGYYGCHRGQTQQWRLDNGKLKVATDADACLGVAPRLGQYQCAPHDREQIWHQQDQTFRPEVDPSMCLTAGIDGQPPSLALCSGAPTQRWEVRAHQIDHDLGVRYPSRYN